MATSNCVSQVIRIAFPLTSAYTFETQLDVAMGIHQALLDETIGRALSSANTFHKWMFARNIPART